MYVWMMVAVLVAVGVLLIAGKITPSEPVDDVDGQAPVAPGSAWTSMWLDFCAGTSSLRARLGRIGRRSRLGSGDNGPRRVAVRSPSRAADREPGAAASNTSIDDFFEATATSEPAYLDAAELSDALHHLRH